MDILSVDLETLCNFLGAPVKVEYNVGRQAPVYGNVYAIDPISRTIVMARFGSTTFGQPQEFVIIPGSSVAAVHECKDDALESGCVQKFDIKKLQELLNTDPLPSEDESVVAERLKRLKDGLSSKKVPFTMEGDAVLVGPVKIERPYAVDNFSCTNVVALRRTRALLSDFIK